jgi:hypothetical protein
MEVRRHSAPLVVAFALAAGFALVPRRALAQNVPTADASHDAAQDAHRHALELFDRGHYAEALAEFKRAYGIAPSFRILYNMGLSDVALGDALGAVEAYSSYLREGGERIPAERRATVEAEIARLSKQLASLNVDADEPGADVTVDGNLLGQTPFSRQLRLNAGRHTVAVRSADGTLKTQTVTLAMGQEQRLHFQARPVAAATSSSAVANGQASNTAPSGTRRQVPWIAWGVTGALGASAAVTGLLALGAHSDEREAQARRGVTRQDLSAARSKVENFALATDILLAGTAVAAGVSLYFTLRPTGSTESQTSLLVGPGSVSLRGRF